MRAPPTVRLDHCEYCGVAVGRAHGLGGRPGFRYGDGRAICAPCHASAIKSPDQLRAVWRQVARSFERLGLSIDWNSLPVQMLDKGVLQREAGRANVVGLAQTETTLITVNSKVSILYGLPAVLAAQTLGHEAGHVWCRENRVRFQPAECEEGFANVIACLVLDELPGEEARRAVEELFANPDLVYGGRFREQWAEMRKVGWESYRDRVRQAPDSGWASRWLDRLGGRR